MVKVIAPLHSTTAQGSLARQLTYRRGPHGTTVTKFPGHPKPRPPALQLNAILMPRLRGFLRGWGFDSDATWDQLAIPRKMTRAQTSLSVNLPRLKRGEYLKSSPDRQPTEIYPPEPVIHIHTEEATRPVFYASLDVDDWDYLVLYASDEEAFTPSEATLVTFLLRWGKWSRFTLDYAGSWRWWWHAVAWYPGTYGTQTSVPANLAVPQE